MKTCLDCAAPASRGPRCGDCSIEVEESPDWCSPTPVAPVQSTRSTRQLRSCEQCGGPIRSYRREARFCSLPCSGKSQATRRAKIACAEPACSYASRKRGLCNTHYNRRYFPDSRKQWPADPERVRRKDLAKSKRRRAIARGVTAEMVDRYVVGERDGWRCGICRRKVDQRKVYPHPMSASLDHVVPLSQGGEHTYANVRISHLRCNVVRRDRGGDEQLALIG